MPASKRAYCDVCEPGSVVKWGRILRRPPVHCRDDGAGDDGDGMTASCTAPASEVPKVE